MNRSTMNAAAGKTSSSVLSNCGRVVASAAMSLGDRSVERIDEDALHRHVYLHDVVERGGDRSPYVQHHSRGSHDIEQRIAPGVLDVVDAARDGVHASGPLPHRDLLGTDR